jgi:tetratricopeptide (TPR) repeat protein
MPESGTEILRAGGALAGSATGLDILDLPSLVQALAANRRTGTLKVNNEAGDEAWVYFQEGSLRLASSPAADSSCLEDALLKARLLDREGLGAVREAARNAGLSQARTIIDDGRFDPSRLKKLLIAQVTDRAADLMAWQRVHCEFFPGRLAGERLDPELAAFSPGVIADGILLEAARRQDEWERIRQVFDPDADVFTQVPDRPRIEAKEHWTELAGLIDGHRDVAEIAALSTLSGFEVRRGLLDMIENGLVQVRPPAELACMGDLAAANGDPGKALRLFRRAWAADDTRNDLLVKMAAACEALGDVKGARSHLMAFVNRSMELNQFSEAAGSCRQLIRLDPENPEPRTKLFRILLALGEKQELAACGRELALLYEKEKALVAAGEVLAKLRELFPDDNQIAEIAARIRLAAAERTEAILDFEQLAESYLAKGDLENAARTFRKIVYEIDEECLEARIQLAECLIKMGRADEAVAEYNKMAGVLSRTGVIAESARMPFELRINRRIAELDTNNVASREWLAETYATRKDQKNSLACFDQLAAIHRRAKDGRKLAAVLRRTVELFPKELTYREQLADCYLAEHDGQERAKTELAALCQAAWEQQDYDAGYRAAEKLLELDAFHMPAHIVRANALLGKGDRKGAAERLFAVAQAFASVDLSADAIEVLRTALGIDASRAEAQRLLAQQLDRTEDVDGAINHYRLSAKLEAEVANFGLARADLKRLLELSPSDTQAIMMLHKLPAAPKRPE